MGFSYVALRGIISPLSSPSALLGGCSFCSINVRRFVCSSVFCSMRCCSSRLHNISPTSDQQPNTAVQEEKEGTKRIVLRYKESAIRSSNRSTASYHHDPTKCCCFFNTSLSSSSSSSAPWQMEMESSICGEQSCCVATKRRGCSRGKRCFVATQKVINFFKSSN